MPWDWFKAAKDTGLWTTLTADRTGVKLVNCARVKDYFNQLMSVVKETGESNKIKIYVGVVFSMLWNSYGQKQFR